ncbi:M13-type metalloendopeptidase [Streptomyces jumonjinensis]|uniref:M13 family metallopeptidase n=1 Tax=Streptomyces jumonjinensis TaxID=1945 RepID=A0A646KQP5_STRJU|nr:M13 family metallopeptidase [Streptomyces jumonjinensis]MQT04398.1 M13 family metallopeptidase [Streptomyces jumonjinensis]
MSSRITADDVDTDPATRPQDDFYTYANGHWTDTFTLPDHRAEVTMLSLLAEKVQDDVVAVIRSSPGPATARGGPGRQIADLYAGFMDEARIEERGPADLATLLDTVRAVADRVDLARLMGRLQREGVGGPVQATVATDTAGTRGYLLTLTQSGLALPSSTQYLGAAHTLLREQYAEHQRRMMELACQPDPQNAAEAVLRTETALAAAHTPPDTSGRIRAQALTCTAAELASTGGAFPWNAWLEGLGNIPRGAPVQVRPGPFLTALDEWWTSADLEALKIWLIWMRVHEAAPFGPGAVFAENFRFYGQVLPGSRRPRPRWMRATSFVQSVFGDEVGELYLEEHLAPGTLKAAEDLVGALVQAYRGCLEQASWMAGSTHAAALAKLDAIHFEVGHPRDAAANDELHTDPADLLGNVCRGRTRRFVRQLRRLGEPVDRSEWKVPPQAVTAYYRHGLNQVVVPAALLQQPLFEAGGDMTRNFALLGSIVCHEMSHAFDGRGSRYDGDGRTREWWTEADRAEYTRRTALLVEQYDRYVPAGADGQSVSGARTVGENIADITGLTVAHAAFAAHMDARGLVDAERVAETRRFFVLWATMWRAKRTPGRMLERLAHDRHAPPQFRCNGVLGHVPAFYAAFSVTENDPMSIRPSARFTLL